MKKTLISATIITMLLMTPMAWAENASSHAGHGTETATPTDLTTNDLDIAAETMQDMREKIMVETDPAKKRELMHQHMKTMRENMQKMSMMGGGHHSMDHSSMPMGKRMDMMEKRMGMMENMMGEKHSGGMMMHGMMKKHGKKQDDARVKVLEQKVKMMEEMMNGMILMQEMNLQEKP